MRPPAADEVAVLICEDVRQEKSGRSSFLGVYGPSLELERLPAILPSLCATVLIKNPHEAITHVMAAVHSPSGRQLLRTEHVPVSVPPEAPLTSIHTVKAFPVLLDSEGDLRFVFTFNRSDEIVVERSLRVRVKGPRTGAE